MYSMFPRAYSVHRGTWLGTTATVSALTADLVSLKNIDFNHDQYRSAGVNLG